MNSSRVWLNIVEPPPVDLTVSGPNSQVLRSCRRPTRWSAWPPSPFPGQDL